MNRMHFACPSQPMGRWRDYQSGDVFANVFAEEITPHTWEKADVGLRAFRAEAVSGQRSVTGYGIAADPSSAVARAAHESLERLAAHAGADLPWQGRPSDAEYPDISLGVASGVSLQIAQLKARMELIEKTALHVSLNLLHPPPAWDWLPLDGTRVLLSTLVESLRDLGYVVESRLLLVGSAGSLVCAVAVKPNASLPVLFGSAFDHSPSVAQMRACHEMALEFAVLHTKVLRHAPLLPYSNMCPLAVDRPTSDEFRGLWVALGCEDLGFQYEFAHTLEGPHAGILHISHASWAPFRMNGPSIRAPHGGDFFWSAFQKNPFAEVWTPGRTDTTRQPTIASRATRNSAPLRSALFLAPHA